MYAVLGAEPVACPSPSGDVAARSMWVQVLAVSLLPVVAFGGQKQHAIIQRMVNDCPMHEVQRPKMYGQSTGSNVNSEMHYNSDHAWDGAYSFRYICSGFVSYICAPCQCYMAACLH